MMADYKDKVPVRLGKRHNPEMALEPAPRTLEEGILFVLGIIVTVVGTGVLMWGLMTLGFVPDRKSVLGIFTVRMIGGIAAAVGGCLMIKASKRFHKRPAVTDEKS